MLFEPYVRFHFYSSLSNSVAAYWEIAAHSAYDMFSKYNFLEWQMCLFLVIASLYL